MFIFYLLQHDDVSVLTMYGILWSCAFIV